MSAPCEDGAGARRPSAHMRRRDLLLVTCLAATLPVLRARADALPPPDAGTAADIVSIDVAHGVIVLRIGRRDRQARFDRLTRVRVHGMLGAVTDLRPGMHVTVRFAASETGRERATLVSIDA